MYQMKTTSNIDVFFIAKHATVFLAAQSSLMTSGWNSTSVETRRCLTRVSGL